MKNMPPEIDRLLWAVAEDPSYEAADEFVQRYPQYAGELARRRTLVSGLKKGRPESKRAERSVPQFRPRTQTAPAPRWALALVATMILGSIAIASYTLTSMANGQKPKPKPESGPTVANVTPQPVPKQYETPAPTPKEDPEPKPESKPEEGINGELPPSVGMVNLSVRGADLESSLVLLGEEAKVSVIVAPGMPKTSIDADYRNVPLNQVLIDLGHKYGFTPFDQGDGSIIIVPATSRTEDNRATSTQDHPARS